MRADLAAHARLQVRLRERTRLVPALDPERRHDWNPESRTHLHRKRPTKAVEVDGRRFRSALQARLELRIGVKTINRWLDTGRARYV